MLSKKVVVEGKLVGVNRNPKSGHFYELDDAIYRAVYDDTEVQPICSQWQLDDAIKRGVVLDPKQA